MNPGQVPVQGWPRLHRPVAEHVTDDCRVRVRVIKRIGDRKDQEAAIPLSTDQAAGDPIVEHEGARLQSRFRETVIRRLVGVLVLVIGVCYLSAGLA